jgi:hypothetical protein
MLELRDHPLINANFLQAWPPPWVSSMNGEYKSASGEIGILKAVWMNEKSQQTIFLAITHNGQRYVGCMALSDIAFCHQLYAILQNHIGRMIKEIGDLDLSHTL